MYIEDILETCGKILRYTEGMSREQFEGDERTYDAVIRNLEIMGEAAKHVPDEVREKVDKLEWRKLTGLRDVLAHAYFGIDDDILWNVVSTKVPEVKRIVATYLDKKKDSGDES
jgi:uncharacterized protein with HEPN domain